MEDSTSQIPDGHIPEEKVPEGQIPQEQIPEGLVPQSRRFRLIGAARDEVRGFVASLGEPAFRADQILRWIYASGVADLEAMTNLPEDARTRLAARAVVYTSAVTQTQRSRDGTEKLLVTLADGEAVEAVLIPEGRRHTVCVSTQVGCPVGCVFCASGLGGLHRNLTAGEILEQALHARSRIEPPGELTHIVVMGIGEPLANYDALVRALRILTAPWGLGLSPRRITVSTVGLPDRIRALAAEGLGVHLAISLHAADDLTRRRLVPGASPVREVIAAARDYVRQTHRELTLEVVLVKDVNDSVEDARGLAELIKGLPALVNLLPLNPVAGLPWQTPPAARVQRFVAELRRRGVNVQERRRRGADIDAACGQLRRRSGSAASGLTARPGGPSSREKVPPES